MSAFSIAFLPFLPWWTLALLGGLALLLLGFALWRRARGVWWRAAAFLLIGLGLLQPHWLEEQRQTHPDVAIALIDESPSQDTIARECGLVFGLRLCL